MLNYQRVIQEKPETSWETIWKKTRAILISNDMLALSLKLNLRGGDGERNYVRHVTYVNFCKEYRFGQRWVSSFCNFTMCVKRLGINPK